LRKSSALPDDNPYQKLEPFACHSVEISRTALGLKSGFAAVTGAPLALDQMAFASLHLFQNVDKIPTNGSAG
jgi:hypothetical protein